MKYEDLLKKLEGLKAPEIGLSGHRQALRMALLNSARFRRRTAMDWAKVLAPVAAAVLLVASLGIFAAVQPGSIIPSLGENQISKFSSYAQLQYFIETNTQSQYAGGKYFEINGGIWGTLAPAPSTAEPVPDYSITNIQVAGVDEADIVKTDGQYIYVVSGNKTIIVKAYPPEQARVLSEIEVTGTVVGIFVNGDRLVIFGDETPYYPYYFYNDVIRLGGPSTGVSWAALPYMPYYASPKTFVKVYDISDRENPRLQRDISADGQYLSSRMIGDYAYVVISQPVYGQDDKVGLPAVSSDGVETEIPATDIYYSDVADYYYTYTTIMAINTQDNGQEPTYETILLGASSNLYVSLNNIYLTFPVWGGNVGDGQGTSIYRIQISGDNITYVANGQVPGMVLNQFSMDEYDGYFRVATTTWNEGNQNNVFVLNMSLNITGALTDLAQGETIRSARFMGDRCYLVTFKQVDPLFVIDLKDPYNPEVLGYLKVTGYSDYLQPYDETHIIGIGKETTDAGTFAWYQGVKISLFDVSDVRHPVEISKLEIGDRGSDSPVLWDHKALLFDRSRNLLVMPILEAKVDVTKYSQEELNWAYGEPVYQGAYVFNVTLDQGIQLKGRITHIENPDDLEQGYYYYYSPFAVERSLYIGDVLYTVSQAKVMMNDLESLDYINEVQLPASTWAPYEPLPVEPGPAEPPVGGSGVDGSQK
jgi:inhibitor of cysteine peptidase